MPHPTRATAGTAGAPCTAAPPRTTAGHTAAAAGGADLGTDPAATSIAVGGPLVIAGRIHLLAGIATSDLASAAVDDTAGNSGVLADDCLAGAMRAATSISDPVAAACAISTLAT